MTKLILTASICIIGAMLIIILLMAVILAKLDEMIRLLREIREDVFEEDDPDKYVECPECTHVVAWYVKEPDVGRCTGCHRIWQNHNTLAEPRLKEIT